ncbi:MAG: hypothetical protein ACFB2W_06640 [Leptolyngbyaceae cyanobacterium]
MNHSGKPEVIAISQDRLADIQSNLNRLYEQLAGEEEAFLLEEEANKTRIQQKMQKTWQRIRTFEQEYVQRFSQKIKRDELSEPLAKEIAANLVDEIEVLEAIEKRDEVGTLLRQILTELNKPQIPASAKLKVAIPIIPNIISYDLEGDTESIMRRLFPTFVKAYVGLKSLAPKKP